MVPSLSPRKTYLALWIVAELEYYQNYPQFWVLIMGGHGVRVEKEDEDRKKWRRGKEEVEEEVKKNRRNFLLLF